MKKLVVYITVMLVGAVACINKPDVYDPEIMITFQPAIWNTTKSAYTQVYPSDVPFKVWAYASSILIDGQEVSCTDGQWTIAKDYYWPSSPQTTDFYAWSPSYASAGFSLDEGISFNDFDVHEDSDFLYARPVKGALKPLVETPVSLIFETPLCEIEFYVYASAEDNVTIWITGIELQEMYTTGNFCLLPSENWSGLGDPSDTTVFNGKLELSAKPQIVGKMTRVIPQHIRPVVHFMYMMDGSEAVIKRTEVLDMADAPIPAIGKKREYILKISQDCVTVQNPK